MRGARWMPALLCMHLAACAAAPDPSLWSAPQLIAPALQWNAPAAAASRDQVAFVWTGFDAEHVHQDARLDSGEMLQPAVTLPLPPTHPLDQQLIAGHAGQFHLFWLDVANDGAGNRLYSALLRPDLQIERGPIALSTAPTYQFAVMADEAGGAIAVWSQGHPAEPELWTAELDATGLPRAARSLAANSQHPALARRPDGAVQVFRESEGQLWTGPWVDGAVPGWTALTATVGRRPGDRLEGIWASACGAALCAGWNVTRSDGSAESWLASGPADATAWTAPRRLEGLSWLEPASGLASSSPALDAAAQTGEGLSLVTIRAGVVALGETAVAGVTLPGAPALVAAGDSWLLAWPTLETDYANLWLTRKARPPA